MTDTDGGWREHERMHEEDGGGLATVAAAGAVVAASALLLWAWQQGRLTGSRI